MTVLLIGVSCAVVIVCLFAGLVWLCDDLERTFPHDHSRHASAYDRSVPGPGDDTA